MNCVFCNAELKEGDFRCSVCGKNVQIVPDYNEFDDDYISGLVGSSSDEEKKARAEERRKKELLAKVQKQKRMRTIIAVVCGVVLLLIVAGTAVGITSSIKKKNFNSFDYQVKKAQEAYAEGDIKTAISYYDRALVLDEGNVSIMLTLADIYISDNDTASAKAFLNQIRLKEPENEKAVSKLVSIYDGEKDYDSILSIYNDIKGNSSFKDLFKPYITAEPEFGLPGGEYKEEVTVSLISPDGNKIYYTTDGSNPKEFGSLFESEFTFSDEGEHVVQAVCVNELGLYSAIRSQKYEIRYEKPAMPVVMPDGGSYISETFVSIDVPEGCSAYYLWGTSIPGSNSTKYTKPFAVPEGNNVLSVIIINDKTDKTSEVYRGRFEYYSE